MIEVSELLTENAAEWKAFLDSSNNGTLFHDLDFLAYHPEGKFTTRHLLFRENGKLQALLPAAVVRTPQSAEILQSPYGASVGGFVSPPAQSADTVLALVATLQDYVASASLDGIEMRLMPAAYLRDPNDQIGFALSARGFQLVRRWLTHIVALPAQPDQVLARMKSGKSRDVRMGLRRGLVPVEAGAGRLGDFYRLLLSTQAKHQSTPTHSLEDLERLFRLVPNRLRLFLCEKDGQPLAGVLVFVLNAVVAYTFYICQDEETDAGLYPTTVLVAHVAQQMASEGFRNLDLGPTSFDDMSLNRGLAFFKEGFGARGFCRDTWRWIRG